MAKEDIQEEKDMEDFEPRIYEVGYHVLSTISEERVPEEVAKVKEAIVSGGGIILSEEEPKLMHLAYPMDKVVANKRSWLDTAFFGWVKFETDPQAINSLKKVLDNNESLLRFLIIKTVRENTMIKKSLLLAKKALPGDREEKDTGEKKPEPVAEINEEELDKQIEGLVV